MMCREFARRLRATSTAGAGRRLRRAATAIASLAIVAAAAAGSAGATPWPHADGELARVDLAALTDPQNERNPASAGSARQRSAPAQSVAASRPEPVQKDLLSRILDWLDSSEREFQDVIVRRLATPPGGSDAGALQTGGAAAGAFQRVSQWSEAVASELGMRISAFAEDLARRAGVSATSGVRVAQAGKLPAGAPQSSKPASSSPFNDALAPVTDWLERSAQDFQSIIVRRLSVPSGPVSTTPAAAPSALPAAKGGDRSVAAPPAKPQTQGAEQRSIVDRMGDATQAAKDWLTQSKRDFQERVVEKLAKPDAGREAAPQQTPQAGAPPPAAAPAPKVASDDAARTKAEDDARAARQAVDAAERRVRELRSKEDAAKSTPEAESPAAKAAAGARQAEDEARARKAAIEEAARKAVAEQKRLADEAVRRKQAEAELQAQRAAEDAARRKADEARRQAEAAATAARQKEAAARMAEEASRKADALLAVPKDAAAQPAAAVEKRTAGARVAEREVARRAAVAANKVERVAASPVKSGSCRGAGRRVKPPAVYVVARGDSLWAIARRHYKKGSRWVAIHKANDDKIDKPDLIFPCQHFYLPRL